MAAFSRISEHWFNDQRVLVSRIRKQCWQAGLVSIHPSLALPKISSSWDAAPVHPQSCSPALGHEGTVHPQHPHIGLISQNPYRSSQDAGENRKQEPHWVIQSQRQFLHEQTSNKNASAVFFHCTYLYIHCIY